MGSTRLDREHLIDLERWRRPAIRVEPVEKRCAKCTWVLYRGRLEDGSDVSFKCQNCGEIAGPTRDRVPDVRSRCVFCTGTLFFGRGAPGSAIQVTCHRCHRPTRFRWM